MKINTILLIVTIILIIGLAGLSLYVYQENIKLESNLKDAEKQIEELKKELSDLKISLGLKTYTNELFGFKFDYPEDYIFTQGSPTKDMAILFGKERPNWLIDVSGHFFESDDSFESDIINKQRNRCVADAPFGSTYCTDVVKQEIFSNRSGINGYEIYITEVHEIYSEINVQGREFKPGEWEETRGPIFIVKIPHVEFRGKDYIGGIYFELTDTARYNDEASDIEVILRDIVDSLKFY